MTLLILGRFIVFFQSDEESMRDSSMMTRYNEALADFQQSKKNMTIE
jgi:hypothetical protein